MTREEHIKIIRRITGERLVTEWLPPALCREFVGRSKKKAVYIEAASSAKCPLCGNWGDPIHKCLKRLPGGKTRRYFECPECGFRFSAEG